MIGEPYQTLEQQHETAEFGMWIFLATELMLFGGLFTAYTVYRTVYPDGFAEGSRHLDLVYAGPNTAILLISSLTMALAVQSSHAEARRRSRWLLIATAILGILFMVIKGAEYYKHYTDGMVPALNWTYAGAPSVEMFFIAYFLMTGLHAVHLLVAIGLVMVLTVWRARATTVEMVGLYWHFVDIVWTFLLPLLYLFGFNS